MPDKWWWTLDWQMAMKWEEEERCFLNALSYCICTINK